MTNKNRAQYEKILDLVYNDMKSRKDDDAKDMEVNESEYYVWRTCGDDRVRGSHADREGQVFCWDNPPEGGHPGEGFGCRCSALIPIMPTAALKAAVG